MQKILIVGATSAIAEATARIYAMRGAHIYLLARNAARLQDIANDLSIRGAAKVTHAIFDVTMTQQHEAILDAAWQVLDNVDIVLIAHGTLPDQQQCEASASIALSEFATNATSTIALSTTLANRMQAAGKGTIVVISSVAGDRGRASNYLYGAAKAAVSTFLSGLRQRLSRDGVNVLTIKPGFVDTPMTRDFTKGLLWAKPEGIAKGIINAIERRRSVVYLPWFWAWIMLIIRFIPEAIFKRIRL